MRCSTWNIVDKCLYLAGADSLAGACPLGTLAPEQTSGRRGHPTHKMKAPVRLYLRVPSTGGPRCDAGRCRRGRN